MNNLYLISNGSGKPIKTKYVWGFFFADETSHVNKIRHIGLDIHLLCYSKKFYHFFRFFQNPIIQNVYKFQRKREIYFLHSIHVFMGIFFHHSIQTAPYFPLTRYLVDQ